MAISQGLIMFIAIYEFKIKPGKEEQFRASWLKTTQGIYKEFGSIGSRLHATETSNVFIGYAQWPSKAQWAKDKGDLSPEYYQARQTMHDCIESSSTLHELEVTDDYLQANVFNTK